MTQWKDLYAAVDPELIALGYEHHAEAADGVLRFASLRTRVLMALAELRRVRDGER